ncbi:MAG TPA: methyl-accepting chemotaxis protein [Methanospirillum sp.]|nr:methyl-accepting chemotaxis protein [Methanospirillum sp.]
MSSDIPYISHAGEVSSGDCTKEIASLQERIKLLTEENSILKIEKDRYESILRFNPNPILVWNTDLQVIDTNDAFTKKTGYSREKALSLKLSDFVYLYRKGDGIQETLRDKQMKTGEATFQFPSGVFSWVRYTIPVLDERGNIRTIISVYNDVTELKSELEEIEVLKNRSNAIINENPYPMLVWNPELTITTMNGAALKLMGFSEHDIGRISVKDFTYISQTGTGVSDTFKSGKPSTGEAVVKFTTGVKTLERHNIPLTDKSGKVSHVLSVYYDLTNQKQAITDIMQVIKTAEKGDLRARTDEKKYTGDFFEISRGINQILQVVTNPFRVFQDQLVDIASGAEEVNASVEEVSAGTTLLAENSNTLSHNAEQGEEGVKQILRAMEDLSTTVSNIAIKGESVARLASSAEDKSKLGIQMAKNTETAMEGITRTSAEVDTIVHDIRSQMDQIGKIVKLISDIANQTNLLALNAAIEAARAGEAGRGFAVVAAEVKSLAQESRQSAENIADMINALQTKSQKAAEAVGSSVTNVKEGNALLSETITAFTSIAESIEDISNHVTDMASVTEEQAASVEEITASVNEVSSLLNNTVRQALDSAAATEEASSALAQIVQAIEDVSKSVETVSAEMSKFEI